MSIESAGKLSRPQRPSVVQSLRVLCRVGIQKWELRGQSRVIVRGTDGQYSIFSLPLGTWASRKTQSTSLSLWRIYREVCHLIMSNPSPWLRASNYHSQLHFPTNSKITGNYFLPQQQATVLKGFALSAIYSVLGLGRYGVCWANQHPSN